MGTRRTRPLGHRSGLAQGSSLHGPPLALVLCHLRTAGHKPRPWPLPPSQPCHLGDLQHGGRWVTWVPGGSQRVPELEPERLPCVEGEGDELRSLAGVGWGKSLTSCRE